MILGSDLFVYENEVARLLGERAKVSHNFQLSLVMQKRGELQQQTDIEAWAWKSFERIQADAAVLDAFKGVAGEWVQR